MNNKTKLLVTLGLMIITLTSITFTAFFISKNQTNDNKVLSGCFDTTFTENSASINMTKALPLTDEQGLNTEPYSFTLSNTCSINADYTVLLNVKNNSFSDEYISYNYSGNEVNNLSTASLSNVVPSGYTKSYILGTGTLKRGKSETINIKLWLNELADYQSMTNKAFEAEIQIVSRVSTNQQYGDVTLAYTKDGEDTDMTFAELRLAKYYMNSISCSEGSAEFKTSTDGYRTIYYSQLPANCSIDFKKNSNIYCVDDDNNEVDCPQTFTMGDRIAIGREAPQYFRYLRTTDTTQALSECGGETSTACFDGVGDLHRFMAENNLKAEGNQDDNIRKSRTAIATDALQDPNDSASINAVYYAGSGTNYETSIVKTYMTNYENVLNTLIDIENLVSVNLLSLPEARILFRCETNSNRCSTLPDWAKNSNYWLGSAYNNAYVYAIRSSGEYERISPFTVVFGARPVVSIPSYLI